MKMWHLYKGVLFGHKEEGNCFICRKMNGVRDHYVKCNKSVPSRQVLQAFSHVEGSLVRKNDKKLKPRVTWDMGKEEKEGEEENEREIEESIWSKDILCMHVIIQLTHISKLRKEGTRDSAIQFVNASQRWDYIIYEWLARSTNLWFIMPTAVSKLNCSYVWIVLSMSFKSFLSWFQLKNSLIS